jgi:predicted extracellular nuclease
VSATSQYREVVIVADAGKDATVLSPRGTLVLRENDANPERIMLDDTFINLPDILSGARFTQPIVGIISYDFGNFRLQPTEKLKFIQGELTREQTTQLPEADQLAVATYNVENLNAQINPDRFDQLAKDIVLNLGSPDILALQEIQYDDGTLDSQVTSAETTLKALTTAIQQIDGPKYAWLAIDPQRNADGGVLGGNIRTVLLYRADRGLKPLSAPAGDATTAVQITERDGHPQLSLNPGRIDPTNYAFRDSRKPLAAQFSFSGQDVFIIANHLDSKGEDGALYGDIQPPPLLSESPRDQPARLIHEFVLQILAINPQANVIVLGDLNDFPWSKPLQTLAGKELENLIERLPENERYTYIFEGNAEALDHILVSPTMAKNLVYFDCIHINAELFPQNRVSDHDPLIAIFRIN